MSQSPGRTLGHYRLVERKRLERRECPRCGNALAVLEVSGNEEVLGCPEEFCEFQITVER